MVAAGADGVDVAVGVETGVGVGAAWRSRPVGAAPNGGIGADEAGAVTIM
jgi:hypothetical protein